MKQPLAPGLAYFFRGSAVIPLNEAVVFSMEQRTPPIAVKPSGSTTPLQQRVGLLQARLLSGSSDCPPPG